MTAWAFIAALAGLFALGAVLYRSGRRTAENDAFRAGEKADEKVDKAIKRAARLSRAELIERLRDNKDE